MPPGIAQSVRFFLSRTLCPMRYVSNIIYFSGVFTGLSEGLVEIESGSDLGLGDRHRSVVPAIQPADGCAFSGSHIFGGSGVLYADAATGLLVHRQKGRQPVDFFLSDFHPFQSNCQGSLQSTQALRVRFESSPAYTCHRRRAAQRPHPGGGSDMGIHGPVLEASMDLVRCRRVDDRHTAITGLPGGSFSNRSVWGLPDRGFVAGAVFRL